MDTYKEEYLNQRLILKQGISQQNVDNIVELHNQRLRLFDAMRGAEPVDDKCGMFVCCNHLTEIEYRLQANWGFEQNEKFHSWWFMMPHCTCPQMDNMDMVGTKYSNIGLACPIHGVGSIQWTFDRENPIQLALSLISLLDLFSFDRLTATRWKAYFKVLNMKIQKCRKKSAS